VTQATGFGRFFVGFKRHRFASSSPRLPGTNLWASVCSSTRGA
jgi:hypothetical protein